MYMPKVNFINRGYAKARIRKVWKWSQPLNRLVLFFILTILLSSLMQISFSLTKAMPTPAPHPPPPPQQTHPPKTFLKQTKDGSLCAIFILLINCFPKTNNLFKISSKAGFSNNISMTVKLKFPSVHLFLSHSFNKFQKLVIISQVLRRWSRC